MSLKDKWLPLRPHKLDRGDRVTWALMIIGGVAIATVAMIWPRPDRFAELELRLNKVESQLQIEITANHLARLSGTVKRDECDKAVTGYAADNKLVPEGIQEVCAIPWSELNKDATTQTTQERADEFLAKLLPTLADVAPKVKKSACEMFIQMYQQENLTTPPAMNAECGL